MVERMKEIVHPALHRLGIAFEEGRDKSVYFHARLRGIPLSGVIIQEIEGDLITLFLYGLPPFPPGDPQAVQLAEGLGHKVAGKVIVQSDTGEMVYVVDWFPSGSSTPEDFQRVFCYAILCFLAIYPLAQIVRHTRMSLEKAEALLKQGEKGSPLSPRVKKELQSFLEEE